MNLERLVVTISVLCSVAFGEVWSEPVQITSWERGDLAIDSKGVCWCLVGEEAYTYRNEETGWQFEGISPVGWGKCFDKGDTAWWCAEWGFDIHYGRYYSLTGWSDTGIVPAYPSFNTTPYMTADSTEGVWVAWFTDWWLYYVAAYNRYKDGSWDDPQPITDTLENNEIWCMSTDAYGRVWAGWIHLTNWFPSIKVAYHDDGGWSDEMTIYSATDSLWGTLALNLTPDREGGMWAIWSQMTKYDVDWTLLASHWDGESWLSPDTVTLAEYNVDGWSWGGRIAVDASGKAWAVWREDIGEEDPYGDIYYSFNTGHGWSEPAPVSPVPGTDHQPDIAVDGAGRIWCVWGSVRDGGQWGVWASYATGVGVKEPATPATPVTHRLPSLTIDKSVGGEFTFSVSHSNIVRGIVIYDASGSVVRDLTISDNQTIHWDGTDAKGQALSPGVYFVKLSPASSTLKLILIR